MKMGLKGKETRSGESGSGGTRSGESGSGGQGQGNRGQGGTRSGKSGSGREDQETRVVLTRSSLDSRSSPSLSNLGRQGSIHW